MVSPKWWIQNGIYLVIIDASNRDNDILYNKAYRCRTGEGEFSTWSLNKGFKESDRSPNK